MDWSWTQTPDDVLVLVLTEWVGPVAAEKGTEAWMTCVGPSSSCCCAALLSWSATARRAQQRLHRCDFGELEKLALFFFLTKEKSAVCSYFLPGCLCCVDACVPLCCVCGGGTTLCASLSVSGVDDRVFWKQSMSAFEVPCWWRQGSRVSTCGSSSTSRTKMKFLWALLLLLFFFFFFLNQINLSKSFSASQKRAALLSAAAVELHRLRLRLSSTCLITTRKNTLFTHKTVYFSLQDLCDRNRRGGEICAWSKFPQSVYSPPSHEVAVPLYLFGSVYLLAKKLNFSSSSSLAWWMCDVWCVNCWWKTRFVRVKMAQLAKYA